jgi:nucleotide-binding universal stress UspA family protein
MAAESSPPPFQTIVVGYDGTREAEHALTRAASLAQAFTAKIVVIDVASPAPIESVDGAFGLTPYSYPAAEAAQKAGEALWRSHRARVEAFLAAAGVPVEFAGVVGQPVGEIVDVAEQHGADLIVVGTREAGLLERLLGGSVSQGVARHAHCDVLIVHPPVG